MTVEHGRSPSGRAGGPSDLSRCASQPEALVPNAAFPVLGGGLTPSEWLRSIAAADRKIKANARASEGEAIAIWIDTMLANERQRGLPESRPLRLCGYCVEWQRKPCGDGCRWSFRDPTFEMLEAKECGNRSASAMSAGTAETAEQAQGEARQRDGCGDSRDAQTPTVSSKDN